MLRLGARRAISTTARVYPPIMPTAAVVRRGLGSIRWVPTIFALVCIGYGVTSYRRNQVEKYLARSADMEIAETQRRRRNAMLQDSYGEKSSLEDLERAMATYESQRGTCARHE